MNIEAAGTIILTGAGASKPLRYATTTEFFDEQLSGIVWQPQQAEAFSALTEVLGEGSKDVEDILRTLQPAEDFLKSASGTFLKRLILKINKHGDGYSKPIDALATQVRNRCFDVYGKPPDDREVKELYLPLLDFLDWNSARLDIFTLNYDLVLDSILDLAANSNVRAYDGFAPGRNRYNDERYFSQEYRLRLFRLHGSLSWIETDGAIVNQRHCARTDRPHIYIPPGFKGDPTRGGYKDPIIKAHGHFVKALENAARCIIIGYSFRDPHINNEIQAAFHKNGHLKLFVVDPSTPNSPDSAFTELASKNKGRFIHIKHPFGTTAVITSLRETAMKLLVSANNQK